MLGRKTHSWPASTLECDEVYEDQPWAQHEDRLSSETWAHWVCLDALHLSAVGVLIAVATSRSTRVWAF